MALSGVHIEFGGCGIGLYLNAEEKSGFASLLGTLISSQTMTVAGTSTITAPPVLINGISPICSIMSSAAIYYATGPRGTANATSGPRRYFDPTYGPRDIFVNPNDVFDWILA